MSAITAVGFALLIIGLVGAVVQLPEIFSHHINQPVQRARRVRALRRKLALIAAAVLAAALSLYWAVGG